jgi:SanA protein
MARNRWRSIFFLALAALFLPLAGLLALIAGSNAWIVLSTRDRVHDEVATVERREVALVLGTSKRSAPGTPSQHFENRLAAAAALFASGKVGRILVSGHRESDYYDETRDMVAGLKALGVPESALITDDRGDRTLDSVERARTAFGFDRLVIVSDDFHVNRALFIADRRGLDAIALRSKSVDYEDSRKVRLRECFARVKAVLDLYVHDPGASARAEDAAGLTRN